jgi:KDO2-lipid IV(A) lauroyltransferase
MIGYFFLRLVAEIFRFVPFGAMYALSDGMAFLLFKIVGYRKKVVLENLRQAFPEKSEAEIRRIARLFYQNLTDTTLETVKYFSTSLAETNRRCPVLNPELVNRYLDREQSVILAGSHYNNWEICGLTMPPTFHGATVTAFKPLTNKTIDRYLNGSRSRTGMEMISMEETFKEMRKRAGKPVVWILLADQSPSSRKSAHWVEFLGQDSASLPGVDVLARKFDFPVLYFHVRRAARRGFYEVLFEEIWTKPAAATEADITRAFARHLETKIREQPENWLWSHKRWKIKREG